MSPSRTLTLTLVLYLSLAVAFVNAHDDPLQQRGHHDYNMKRSMMRKRAPLPQAGGPVIGAAPLPIVEPSSTSTTKAVPESTTSTSTAPSPSSTTSESKAISFSASSVPSGSVSQKSTSSRSSVGVSSSPPPQITSTTDDGVSTIIVPGVTRTSAVAASDTVVPDKQGNASSSQAKNTTLTVLIAIAASVGGIFILWTIFRKWKLSSSKDFDRRLNPIDWQPTTGGEDDQIPGLTRRPSIGSLHSSGHGHGATGVSRAHSDHSHSNPFDDFDRPAQHSAPVQVGGYADLARGASPTQMQQRNQGGPSYNHGITPLPLHHQAGY